MKPHFYISLTALILLITPVSAQQVFREGISPDILKKRWPAQWISCADAPGKQYGIYYFRKSFELNNLPEKFIIHVSADNRYRLFVNGKSVCTGPARGDLQHWRFESVDIKSHLMHGKNTLAAVVWNFGDHSPNSQMSLKTGFIISGNSDTEKVVNTNNSWKAIQDFSWSPISGFSQMLAAYYVVGPGEKIEGQKHIWGWEQPGFNDSGWKNASPIGAGQPREFGTNGDWMLVPRDIPFMEESELRLSEVRSAEGVTIADGFLTGKSRVDVGANKSVKILFDQGYLTKAYPVLKLNGGRNAEIKISYAESMFYPDGSKGNRNEIEGKVFKGNYDIFLPDGEDNRTFSPLWFRTYRFVQMEIRTKDDPLTLRDFYGIFTAYPLEEKAVFDAGDETLKKIWDTGWRTARLCAAEIYYDCPFYEQMQYVGDTRIQSLISLYVSGDDRLMRNAIELFDVSRIPDGLTQSRYPASAMQIIPPFSLFWTMVVHDYWMNRNDPDYVKKFLPGIESVMGWFERRVVDNGMLGALEWWNFADWTDEWKYNPERGYGGVPDGVSEGGSSIITLQFAYALRKAAELENFYGNPETARRYSGLAGKLTTATYNACWDEGKKLLADTPAKTSFSQHANIFGILAGAFNDDKDKEVLNTLLSDKSLIQATLYFRFYLVEAMKEAGMPQLYLENLGPWRQMLGFGLSTFAEKLDPVRSDCHAWSSSPNYFFLSLVCGIEPGTFGYKTVSIRPNPGDLKEVIGAVPHPLGMIRVKYKINGVTIEAEIELPKGLRGDFVWLGVKRPLTEGLQTISF